MTWTEHHTKSEELAAQAEVLIRQEQLEAARSKYRQAARAELLAIDALPADKSRTLAISVVSAAALWFKAQEFQSAKRVAYRWLATETLPTFANQQLEEILQEIFKRDCSPLTPTA